MSGQLAVTALPMWQRADGPEVWFGCGGGIDTWIPLVQPIASLSHCCPGYIK